MAKKILQSSHVAPPLNSVPPSSLPLTYFDLFWLSIPGTIERVFLYHVPGCTTSVFLSTHLPKLERSLTLALKLFYPLAGRLVMNNAAAPCIRYSDGDSVVLTIAESDDDLKELTSDGPKDNARFHSLVPTLPVSETDQALVALQVTVFPEQGIVVGISMLHTLMDGSSSIHFMRTWAAICKSGDDIATGEDPPLYDRSVIPDPMGLQKSFMRKIEQGVATNFQRPSARSRPNILRATFRLTAARLEGLQKWVAAKDSNLACCSSFTLAVALVWTCLAKARDRPPMEMENLVFPVDCRARFDPPIPRRYFGNCIGGGFVEVPGNHLGSGDGLAAAAAAISQEIKGLDGRSASVSFASALDNSAGVAPLEYLSVAGSPRLGAYKVDFGWGRPAKLEVVSIDQNGALSLAENGGEDKGGMEIGLALPSPVMRTFAEAFMSHEFLLTMDRP